MTPRTCSCALVLLALAGCSGDPAPEGTGGARGGGAGGSAGGSGDPVGSTLAACPPDNVVEPPHTDMPGVYSVPVVPDELEPYASYPVDDITVCWTGAEVRLGYSLPALLVGRKLRVSFEGSFDAATEAFVLSSDDGTATCTPTTAAWSCAEAFTNMVVDLERVAKEAEDLPPEEQAARLDVAEIFGGDPIGLLELAAP